MSTASNNVPNRFQMYLKYNGTNTSTNQLQSIKNNTPNKPISSKEVHIVDDDIELTNINDNIYSKDSFPISTTRSFNKPQESSISNNNRKKKMIAKLLLLIWYINIV